ncbi:protein of unknown function [Pseudomonas mediterranea]
MNDYNPLRETFSQAFNPARHRIPIPLNARP